MSAFPAALFCVSFPRRMGTETTRKTYHPRLAKMSYRHDCSHCHLASEALGVLPRHCPLR